MYAAYHNHVGVANVLIEYNCDINTTDYQGWSALHWSADCDHIEIVKLLIERGCQINIRGNVGSKRLLNMYPKSFLNYNLL